MPKANEFDDAVVVVEKPSDATSAEVSEYRITREAENVKLTVTGHFPDSAWTLVVFRGGSKDRPVYEFLQRSENVLGLDVRTPFLFKTTVRAAHGVASYLDSRGGIQISGVKGMFEHPET